VTFSSEWERVYQQGAQNSVWPWSDLVSYVMRYARPDRQPYRVLELGFGAGANIPFLLSLGVEYFGTEGSVTAVERAEQRFAGTAFHGACCDFTNEIPFAGPFDLVVDRSSLTHNNTASIEKCLDALYRLMSPGGKFIGLDWFATDHPDFLMSQEEIDAYTRRGFTTGQFAGVGQVHFSDESHLRCLFERFEFLKIEQKIKIDFTIMNAARQQFSAFDFVCMKPVSAEK